MEWTGARYADNPTVQVQTWIGALPGRVWELVSDIELMKCFDFCGPIPEDISGRCTSRALKSLSRTKAPMAAAASSVVALRSGSLNTNATSSSKSSPLE